jgi:small subunit ribosomal protein S16
MSITIRLAKTGRKNLPSYRMVVSTTRDKRNGKFLDILGFYNPSMNPVQFKYDDKKFKEWKAKGAQVSPSVTKLITGKYSFTKYNPKSKAEVASATPQA